MTGLRHLLGAACVLAFTASAHAAGGVTFSCKGDNGREIRMDRPPAECMTREMRILNPDGSVREIVPAPMTLEERERDEECKRQRAAETARIRNEALNDGRLMGRFPNEAAHAKARANALDDANKSIDRSQKRLQELASERKPLSNEAEFYVNRQMPLKLKQSLDANDAAVAAQRSLIANQQADVARINGTYDTELARLKRLWGGAAPGSMAPPANTPACRK